MMRVSVCRAAGGWHWSVVAACGDVGGGGDTGVPDGGAYQQPSSLPRDAQMLACLLIVVLFTSATRLVSLCSLRRYLGNVNTQFT